MPSEEKQRPGVSIVIPVYNEIESIPALMGRLAPVMETLGDSEVIFVDDGSSDGSGEALDRLAMERPDRVRVVHLRMNCGKSVALQAGFGEAGGQIVVMMDADLQDQPEEIPKLIARLEDKNLDAVTGWKARRRDPISKTVPSRFFNMTLRRFSGLEIHDFNCGLKAFRRECLEGINLYGQLHRFILVILADRGFKVGEIEVEHAPRLYGQSKFGLRRMYAGAVDFLTVFFITRYLQSPLYFFGFYGLATMLISFLIGAGFIALHFYSLAADYPLGHLSNHPLWILSPVLFLLGMIILFFGLLGELITYHMMAGDYHRGFIGRKVGFPSGGAQKR